MMLRWSVAGKIASDLLGNPAGRASNPCSWVGSVAGVQQRRTRHCVPATGTMTDASKARVGRRLKDLARGPQADPQLQSNARCMRLEACEQRKDSMTGCSTILAWLLASGVSAVVSRIRPKGVST